MFRICLFHYLVNLLLSNLSPLAVKHLRETLLSDISRVVDVEVMKCEPQVLHRQCLLLVHRGSQEVAIVDRAGVVEFKGFEDVV